MRSLEDGLLKWARAERRAPFPDLWPRVSGEALSCSAWGTVAAVRETGRRMALSAAAALAAAYLAGPWLYGAAPGAIPRLVDWVAAAPAWFFSQWGGWLESVLFRLLG